MVVHAEAMLHRSYGHEVKVYERCNAEIERRGVLGKIRVFLGIGWSHEGYEAIAAEIREFQPDIMHVHNYKYLLSPSIFGAAKDLGVPTVLTLHNYRLACPAGQFLRNGSVCEDCMNGFPYRILWHRCASDSIVKNFAQFYLYWNTRRRKLLAQWVDAYIALSCFGKAKFIAAGLPQERVFDKPNFIYDPTIDSPHEEAGTGAIFVGRLSKEKGVDVLVDAWRDIDYPLRIVGDGPLFDALRLRATPQVRFEGPLPHEQVMTLLAQSSFFVLPSVWYEGCPMVPIEAMALGKPVIATDLGPRREMVKDGYNGFLYAPYDVNALRKKTRLIIDNSKLRETMSRNAREFFLTHYTPESNYNKLMMIYQYAISRHKPN
ncbi:MAG: glycosyltransferase family 4 protein [Mobilitalea sp.]